MKRTLDLFFAAACQHSVDTFEPDHEVGDLREMRRMAFELLTEEQREGLLSSDLVLDLMDVSRCLE